MSKKESVYIEVTKGNKFEYIIKDVIGVTMGRLVLLEKDILSKRITLRLKIYKNTHSIDRILTEILNFFFKKTISTK